MSRILRYKRLKRFGIMSDDSFIREVNQELRHEQARQIWDRYGPAAIAVAVAVILGTAAWVGYDYWISTKANNSGDDFSQALALANEGRTDEALAALQALETHGHGAYPLLARMRAATVLADKGDFSGAVAEFDKVAADSSIAQAIRDMARLRAGYLLVDHGSYQEVSARVEALTTDTNPLRHSAREALGLSAWKEGKAEDALAFFDQISSDEAAPNDLRGRAMMVAELIRGSGAAS